MGDADARTVHLLRKTMADMRYDLETLNPNSFVCGQKHKVWVLVFLEWVEHFETKTEQIRWNFLFCNKSASPTS